MLKIKKKGFLNNGFIPGSPYSIKENLGWLRRVIMGPNTNNNYNIEYISKYSVLNNIRPKYTVSFIGDIMDINLKDLIIGDSIKNFVRGSDFLVGNFEATLTEKNQFNGKRHKPQIMNALTDLFDPTKTYLSTANNHSGDFGQIDFFDSVNQLKNRGFHIFGTREIPFLDITSDLRIIGGTQWTNRSCDYLAKLKDSTNHVKRNSFNLLFPHWGYELELFPRTVIIDQGKEFLKNFDALIGHHSHCPQPVSFFPMDNDNKLITYSLGNFCDGKNFEMHNYGILIKVEIGLNTDGKWSVGQCDWTFLNTRSLSKTELIIDTVDNFSEFSFDFKNIQEDYKMNNANNDIWFETEQVAACI